MRIVTNSPLQRDGAQEGSVANADINRPYSGGELGWQQRAFGHWRPYQLEQALRDLQCQMDTPSTCSPPGGCCIAYLYRLGLLHEKYYYNDYGVRRYV